MKYLPSGSRCSIRTCQIHFKNSHTSVSSNGLVRCFSLEAESIPTKSVSTFSIHHPLRVIKIISEAKHSEPLDLT